MPRLPPGLYDRLVDRAVEAALGDIESGLSQVSPLAQDEAPDHLVVAVAARLRGALRAVRGESVSDKLEGQVALTNRVLDVLSRVPSSGTDAEDTIPVPPQRLSAVLEAAEAPREPRSPPRPNIPLRSSDLLINGKHDLSLGPQLRLEIESADRVDLLCSFVKWSGLRIIEDVLRGHLQRRPGSVRVLTTTYMGATERRALEVLIEMGADVRVSYDRSQTRLHAKAWLLHRDSGFSTAFVGSSNLSAAAVLDGLEWNVRLAQADNASILQRFGTAFDQYWGDGSFRAYDPETFSEAIRGERRERAAPFLRFDIEPKSHQARILDELEAERAAGHRRNLVVAATGTGKTVVAALDYRRLSKQLKQARLLFVAHRREILEQSHRTFQVALGDGGFGERLGDGQVPDEWTHVFANIQSLTPERLETLSPDAFDVVIVDEFHHAAAGSYDRLLRKLKPEVLVGLTATPERADGKSVLEWFDGRIASEIRLWEALDHSLLCPFQYFGIGNAPDLRGVKWSRGRYEPSALSNVYTADHMFALRVLQETQKKVADISSMRALGFCVDLAHARFMTDQFVGRGIRARMV
ncbi:MAG: DEAD/DEAH box helicase family protein [Nannocystales bacterium]